MDPSDQAPISNSKMTIHYAGKKWWLGILGLVPAFVIWLWLANPMVVVVDGYGEVEVAADRAVLTYSVVGQGADPTSAINDVNAKVSASEGVLTGVSSQGDISKSQVQVVPTATGGGYQAVVNVGVKTGFISGIQGLISTLYTTGAVAVSQPILSVEDAKIYEKQAFELALKDAKERAVEMGNKNLKFIRRITGVTQTAATSTSTATKSPDEITEIENPETSSGVFKISKTVTVSYKMW